MLRAAQHRERPQSLKGLFWGKVPVIQVTLQVFNDSAGGYFPDSNYACLIFFFFFKPDKLQLQHFEPPSFQTTTAQPSFIYLTHPTFYFCGVEKKEKRG